jgi:hypothetical protein
MVTKDFKKKQENSKIFVEIVENINILISYLYALFIKGYPNSIKLDIIIDECQAFDSENKNIKKIIDNYKVLTNLLEEAQTEAYKERPLIRLIYGQQFYDIYTYLKNSNNSTNINPLLNKISDNRIKKTPNIMNKYNIDNKSNDFKGMIMEIDNFLKESLNINNILENDLYKKNIIKNNFRQIIKPGFYSLCVDKINLEIQIITIYKQLTGNLPLPISLLICTKETNEEEITSFIYRSLLCSMPALFMIINSDNLELSNAQYFLWILEQLYNKNKGHISSSLLILFDDTNSALRKQLTLLNDHDYFIIGNIGINENEINNLKNNYEENPIEVWTSDTAGVGKSTKIKFEAEKTDLKYIYFPIGGSFTRKEIN